MAIEVKIPAIGESITEVTLATWQKSDGDYVEEGEILCDIESDKATVELPAETSGVLKITVEEGTDLPIGAVIATIDENAKAQSAPKKEESKKEEAPKSQSESSSDKNVQHASPAARKIIEEKGLDTGSVKGTGKDGRITKEDAINAKATAKTESAPAKSEAAQKELPKITVPGSRDVRKEKMSRLRKTIATRLVEAKNTTAMLTTFNEVDMKAIMDIRKKYKDQFKEQFGVGLGFMSFFTKAVTIALKKYPVVGAMIEGDEMVFHDFADVGIAVSSDRGLVVPVVRNAESMSLWQIEAEIGRLAKKARDGKITIEDMSGGNFTITNGGVFGSMLSTPIINIPQSAILGMHNIVERPWVVNGEIKIRPMMYIALSYDHRIIDGKDSVGFLKTVKDLLEDPTRMLLDL